MVHGTDELQHGKSSLQYSSEISTFVRIDIAIDSINQLLTKQETGYYQSMISSICSKYMESPWIKA